LQGAIGPLMNIARVSSYLSSGLPGLLCLLQFEGVLLNFLQPKITAQPHQKLQTVHTVGKPPVDLLVTLQCLLVAAWKTHGMRYRVV